MATDLAGRPTTKAPGPADVSAARRRCRNGSSQVRAAQMVSHDWWRFDTRCCESNLLDLFNRICGLFVVAPYLTLVSID